MLQTLFYVPSSWLGLPGLVVWGLLCLGWLVVFAIRDAAKKEGKLGKEIVAMLPVFAFGALAIYLLLPNMQVMGINPDDPLGDPIKAGLAIRGYGVMLMLGVLAGMAVAFARCSDATVSRDQLFELAIWMVVCGMVGARLFFVIQNRERFFADGASLPQIVGALFNMAEGGLVVYGSLIGALIGGAIVVIRRKLPVLQTADLAAPAMAIGLSIGRIGCLMNGCCWGGVCEAPLPAIEFPAGSPAWTQHLYQGQLLGLSTKPVSDDPESQLREITKVKEGIGKTLGLETGDVIKVLALEGERLRHLLSHDKAGNADRVAIEINSKQKGTLRVPVSKLSAVSRRVHPTQIYSAVNALLLCLLLWFWWHVRKADGEVIALMLILYSVSRFLLELIRSDELGQFGTQLTISQIVSLAALTFGIGLFVWCRMFGSKKVAQTSSL